MAVKYVKDFEFSKDAGFSASCKPVKKAMGGMMPSMTKNVGQSTTTPDAATRLYGSSGRSKLRRPEMGKVRTTEFRDANRNGIDDRDELRAAQRMNTRLRSRMQRPRVDRRGRAMIGPEDEIPLLDMDRVRSRTPKAPVMRPNMPEFNISPEEIREYSRGRTFGPDAMLKKGGSVKGKKIAKVMREYKKGELHSGKDGPVVKNPKQAMAIALSEARKMKKAKGGEVKKPMPKKEEGKKKPKMKMEDMALKKMRHAEKYAPGMDLDNIHSYELSQEAKKEKKVEKYAKGGKAHSDVKMDKAMIRKAVHKHESEKHPGESKTKLKKGGLPVHKGSPMYGRK